MTKKLRKQYSPNDKVSILKRHLLVDRVPVSDVCDQYTITPGKFCRWQQQFFENGTLAFERPTSQAPASGTWSPTHRQIGFSQAGRILV